MRRHPERQKKRTGGGRGEKKKTRNFGLSTLRAPLSLGLDPTFVPLSPFGTSGFHHDTHQIQKWIGQNWTKIGLAKVGLFRAEGSLNAAPVRTCAALSSGCGFRKLQESEFLFAFLDDLHIKSHPNRTVGCLHIMRQKLWNHCKISLNHGKARAWNKGGFFPPGCEALQEAARVDDPWAVVWKGD